MTGTLESQRRNARLPRRVRCTSELTRDICEAVRAGVRPITAAALNGVASSTYYEWWEKGHQQDARPALREFCDSIEIALAEWEAADILLIGKAARQENPGEWTAAAWRLERRLPSVYARKTKVDMEATISAKPFVDASKLSLEEQRTLYELLQKAAPAAEELPKDAAPALLALGAGEQAA